MTLHFQKAVHSQTDSIFSGPVSKGHKQPLEALAMIPVIYFIQWEQD